MRTDHSQLPVSEVFQWTKMLIPRQGGDIIHMIGPRRLIKTSLQVTDSFLMPLRGFPSQCSMEKSKKSIYHIWVVVLSKQKKMSAPKNCCYLLRPSTFRQVKSSSERWSNLLLVG